ncbi:unnamed protein product, partial [Discosporangium mesarthrocarpum]
MDRTHLNGGQMVYVHKTHEFVGLGHHVYWDPLNPSHRLYNIHFLFTLEARPPFALRRVSPEFCFETTAGGRPGECEKRQFAMGLELVELATGEEALLIPYGVNNFEAKSFILPLGQALGMLRAIAE